MSISDVFKDHIVKSGGYKGGKSASEFEGKVYKLSSNENLLGCSPKVKQFLSAPYIAPNFYPDAQGSSLRSALTQYYKGKLNYDQFLIANGGSDLIDMIIRSFLCEGDECIVTSPYFTPYSMFAGWANTKVIDIPLIGPKYELDVDGILNAITSQTRLLFLTSPNNPTGTIIEKAKFEMLLDKLPDHILIVYDEVYRQFADSPQYFTAMSYVNKGYPIVAINSFSKAYGLASMRVGYAYTTSEIASYVNKIYRPFQVNEYSIQAACLALEDENWLQKSSEYIISHRNQIETQFQQLKIPYTTSQANFILVHSPDDSDKVTSDMANLGIMVRPADAFGATRSIRITVGTADANDAMISALKTIYLKTRGLDK